MTRRKPTSERPGRGLAGARVLLVGAGGLGSPAALALARSGVGALTLLDDDVVDPTNLHRQTLFDAGDVGHPKGPAAARRLIEEAGRAGHQLAVETLETRLLPDNAMELIEKHDLVLEGADNFATKFLTADAARLTGTPAVQAGAVRWNGWALASLPGRSACMRCVFEDIPRDRVETCAEAGVIGPVVGVLGALEAALAVRVLEEDGAGTGTLWSYRGLEGKLRASHVRPREDCPLCTGVIDDVRMDRYVAPDCSV